MPMACHGIGMNPDTVLADARRRRNLPSPVTCRRVREQAGLTQNEVAELLGVERSTVTRYESGTRKPRGTVRLAYVDLLERMEMQP